MCATKLKLRIYDDPCLRKQSAPVREVGVSERMLIETMLVTMHEHKGVGLAAPQIGINQQIFVADVGEGPIAVINPQILEQSGSDALEEGCLSIPGVMVNVKRPQKILVRYLDQNSEVVECEYSNLMARVFCHEMDHLQGKLIIDYASSDEQLKLKKQLAEIIKQNKSQA